MKSIIYILFLSFISCASSQQNSLKLYQDKSYTFSVEYFDKNMKKGNIYFTPPYVYELGKELLFENAWEINSENKNSVMIDRISFSFFKGKINGDQTPYSIRYYNNLSEQEVLGELTGIENNENKIFLHPPRLKYFTILQFSPFPLVEFPLKIGNKWQDKLTIGNQWGNLFEEGKTSITRVFNYSVVSKENIDTPMGKLMCYKIEAITSDSHTPSFLTTYYNEEFGFIKMEYLNIDKSKLIFTLNSIK